MSIFSANWRHSHFCHIFEFQTILKIESQKMWKRAGKWRECVALRGRGCKHKRATMSRTISIQNTKNASPASSRTSRRHKQPEMQRAGQTPRATKIDRSRIKKRNIQASNSWSDRSDYQSLFDMDAAARSTRVCSEYHRHRLMMAIILFFFWHRHDVDFACWMKMKKLLKVRASVKVSTLPYYKNFCVFLRLH
jgi:hypothetical protein